MSKKKTMNSDDSENYFLYLSDSQKRAYRFSLARLRQCLCICRAIDERQFDQLLETLNQTEVNLLTQNQWLLILEHAERSFQPTFYKAIFDKKNAKKS